MPKKLILKDFELVEISGVDKPAQPTAQVTIMKRKGDQMSDELKKQLEEAMVELEAVKKSLAELATTKEELAKAEAMATLSDDEKLDKAKHMGAKFMDYAKSHNAKKEFLKGLSKEEEKEEFMELDEEKRKDKVKVVKAAEETITVSGQVITKSVVGDQVFSVFKAQQAEIDRQKAEVQKAKDEAEMAELVKRASEEYSKLPGTPEELGAVLKAVSTLDEGVQKSIEAIMNVAKGGVEKSFDTQGSEPKAEPQTGDALEKLDDLAKSYAKENSVGYAAAYAEVISKHADLYQQTLNTQN